MPERNAYLSTPDRVRILAGVFAATGLFLSIGFYVAAEPAANVKPTDLAAVDPAAKVLSFAERVSYQRAIENVYWRHRIWPKENPDLSRRSTR